VPACRRELLNRARRATLKQSRQIAHHAPWLVGQRQLDRLVQILDDIAEPAGNL
jgi:hypothetical protein